MKFIILFAATFLFTYPVLAGLTINLEEASYCDPIYTPSTCRIRPGETAADWGVKGELYTGTGINLDNSGRTNQINRVISIAGNNSAPRVTRSSVGTIQLPPNQTEVADPNSGGPQEQSGGGGFPGLGGGDTQTASAEAPGANVQNPGYVPMKKTSKNCTNVGGMQYCDDKPNDIKLESKNSRGDLGSSIASIPTVPGGVDTKSGSNGNGGGRNPTSIAAAGGISPNQFGQIDNSPNPTAAEPGMAGQLKALAAALGNGALAVGAALGISDGPGGGSETRRLASLNGNRVGPNGQLLGPDGKPIKNLPGLNRNLLKDQYGRYISSSRQSTFGNAGEFMFQGMCGHYAAYATQNRIPYDRASCDDPIQNRNK